MSESFTKKLLNWYRINKRELPWRNTLDPYKIWLSEIILQQTRIDQGLPYYLKFNETYPSVKQLAKAPLERVLKLWQGLGYYSRCRNLHETAKKVWFELNGEFPRSYEGLLELKGIGPYTAAAISSICFNEAVAVVDGNVDRFLSRHFKIQTPVNSPSGKKEIKALANKLIDHIYPGDFNQALMEFGATQCTPKNPLCENCSFASSCLAFNNNLVGQIPVKIKKQKPSARFFNYYAVLHGDELFIRQRESGDIWEGLFEFLLIEGDSSISQKAFEEIIEGAKRYVGDRVKMKHLLTHRILYSEFQIVEIEDKQHVKTNGIWVKLDALEQYPVPRLIDKFIEEHFSRIVEYS